MNQAPYCERRTDSTPPTRGNWRALKIKDFSVFSWEGFQARLGNPTSTNVPTADMRNGTFNCTITFPSAISGKCYSYPTSTTTQIDPSCFDSTAKFMMNYYYPLPNASGSTYNYFATPSLANNANQCNARIDYNISNRLNF